MIDVLQGIGYGIVGLAILVVIGIVVISKLGDTTAVCATDYTYDASVRQCLNSTGGDATDPANAGWTNSEYLSTQLAPL